METEGFTEWNDSVKATAASAEPQTPMKRIANHSRAEMFLRCPQLNKRMGIAMRAEMTCSLRTMKLELSPCVRCVRKGASVAQSAAARKTSAGPNRTMERRGVIVAAILTLLSKVRAHGGNITGYRSTQSFVVREFFVLPYLFEQLYFYIPPVQILCKIQ